FLLEARAISALDHPNVCTLYEIGEADDGRMFLAMAYVEGGTLRDRLAQGPLEPLEAALLAAQVAEGLGAAHARGIIHRDIKPGNLLLGNGLVKIADFGIARLADHEHITRDGQALGTWSYMSPEQANGHEVTPAADLWSLGIVLFEMITGKRPFRAKSELELVRRILESEPPPLGVGGPQLARIVARALEKSPELRYANAREMQEDLLEAADDLAGGEPDTLREMPAIPATRLEPPLLHNLPFAPLGELLKGRSEELQALAQTLADDSPSGLQALVLHGLGGIGKTRLAIDYAWRFGRRYQAVLFVLADSPDGLNSSLAALARADLLDLPERNHPAETEVIGAVLRWLRENSGWLLILDNVDTKEARLAVTKLLPALTAGRVLITSRRRDWPAGVRRRAIDRVLLQPAAEFLLERTGEDRKREPDDAEQALRLAELLDGLPLALEQAAAYITHIQASFREYLEEWERESEGVLGWCDEAVMQYPAPLAVTWQRSLQQLAPTAQAVLRLASLLAPDPIPVEMFESGRELVLRASSLLFEETWQELSPQQMRDDFAELRSLSLVSGQGQLFTVHRLMQEVVRNQIPEERRPAWIELALTLFRYTSPPEDSDSWPTWDLLRPHAAQIIALAAAERPVGESEVMLSWLKTSLGCLLLGKSLYADAEPLLREALELDRRLFGEKHFELANSLKNLAFLLRSTGRFDEAEPLTRVSLEIDRAWFGNRHPVVATDLNYVGLILMEKGRQTESEELLRQALLIDEEAYGEDHSAIARDLHNLALLLKSTGRSSEAEITIQRSLEISHLVHGERHPRTARKMQILAGILRDLGRPDEAEPLARQALEIFEGILGPEHPMTQSARHDLDTLTAA
ncbi:MAG TPA: tetratricopeptide repeat protein, partial [Thermoanaerobaculia bacterium]|nr:tetratricopeptide repeat protein [Thermoanaerobaculia bacterium]